MNNPLLGRLAIVYGPPDSHDPAAYLAEVAKMLVKYSTEQLEAAGDLILKTHRTRTYPTPAFIVTACEDAAYQQAPKLARAETFEERFPAWSDTAIAAADKLVHCAMGQVAARDGWVLGLHDFCRNNGRLPEHHELGALKADAAFVTRSANGQEDLGACGPALRRLAKSMVAKRGEIARSVLGGGQP